MHRSHSYIVFFTLATVLGLLLLSGSARAQVDVTPIVTSVGPLFHYDYTITNNSALDLSVVNIDVFAQPDAVQNLMAADGFQAIFDPGLGIVSFFEGNPDPLTNVAQDFTAGGTFKGFTFDSPFMAEPTTFDTVDVEHNPGPAGTTLGPAAVPEPGTLSVFLIGALAVMLVAARRFHLRPLTGGSNILTGEIKHEL